MKHIFGEKKEKNSKKILSPQLFVFVRCLSRKTNPIKSSFNLFRVLSLCSSLSNNNPRFIFKGSKGVLFCSAKSFVTVFTAVILLSRRRERARYISHTEEDTPQMSQQQTMRERFQKAKWEQFCAHFNNNLKVFLNFDENQWTIETKRRKTGHSEGSFDAYYLFCAEEKRGKTKRFRSLKEVERKLREDARETKEKKTSTEKQSSSPPPPPPPFVVVEGEQQEKQQQQRKSCGRRTGGLTSSFREDEMKFKSAMDDEEEEEEDEDDEPVCPSAFLKTTTKTMGGGRGGGLGRAKVLANTTPSGAQQQRQRQQQHHQRAFHPSRPPFHHSNNNNNNNNNISNSNNNTSAKTHSRLHNSFVANSSRLEVAAVRDDERRITKRNQNGKRKETEETRGQDWRISNPSDAEELLEKKREEDPEVAREHRMLKERFSGKSVANTANSINNNNDNNNTQKENNQRQRRRERNALPSKYEHLALVFNGLKMYRELLRMRNSAETVENICACAKNLVKRDVRFEHLRKIETVRPGTFAFTKRKRDATKNAVDEKHRPEEGRTFVDPKSVRLEILEERVMKRESVDGEDEDCNGDEEENGKKVVKKREKSSLLMSEKERERAREADFHSRLMRLCDEAHVAFCRNHGIVISPSSNVSEQMLWHETFDVEREAPDIAECAVRDAPPLMPPAGGTAAAAATTTTTTTTTSAPSLMLLHTPKPPSSTPSTGTYPLTPLIMTTATKKKVVTERDIDEEVRRMQKENGGVCEDDDNLENDDYLAGNINNASANDGKDSTTTIGVSRQAIRRVLERKIEKDLLHSPSAVALRAENKIKQNLPRIFDLVHSLFATSRKRAFAFDILLHKTHEQLNAKDIGGMFYSRDEIEDCLRTLAKTCSEWCKIERAQDGEELFRIVVGSSSSRSLSDPSSSPSLTPFFSGGAAAAASRGRGRHLMVRKTTTFLPPPSSSSSPRSRQKPTSTTKEREENDDAGFTPTTIQTINPKKRSSFPSNSIFVGNNNNKESSSSSPRDGVAKRVKQKLLLEAAPAFVLGGGK